MPKFKWMPQTGRLLDLWKYRQNQQQQQKQQQQCRHASSSASLRLLFRLRRRRSLMVLRRQRVFRLSNLPCWRHLRQFHGNLRLRLSVGIHRRWPTLFRAFRPEWRREILCTEGQIAFIDRCGYFSIFPILMRSFSDADNSVVVSKRVCPTANQSVGLTKDATSNCSRVSGLAFSWNLDSTLIIVCYCTCICEDLMWRISVKRDGYS